jgi:HD-like signal output (HDOD) protein
MSHIALDEVIRRIHDLPSLPAVVAELLSSMAQEDVDLHYLSGRIALDQALTAKTLRLANSSFYGMPSKVNSIQQAMSVLGLHSVRTLVMACGVISAVPPAAGSALDFDLFWRQAIATAVWARAGPSSAPEPDTAFTAGLLHNLGTLVLATRFPQGTWQCQHGARRHADASVADAELAVFGVDHAHTGSALAAHWRFPGDPGCHQPSAPRRRHRAGAGGRAGACLAEPSDASPAQRTGLEHAGVRRRAAPAAHRKLSR